MRAHTHTYRCSLEPPFKSRQRKMTNILTIIKNDVICERTLLLDHQKWPRHPGGRSIHRSDAGISQCPHSFAQPLSADVSHVPKQPIRSAHSKQAAISNVKSFRSFSLSYGRVWVRLFVCVCLYCLFVWCMLFVYVCVYVVCPRARPFSDISRAKLESNLFLRTTRD